VSFHPANGFDGDQADTGSDSHPAMPMTDQEFHNDQRATLIDELLRRQDEVIRELDELDRRLMAVIEECRPPKKETEEAESVVVETETRKAA